jgi:hypothetical protein
MRRRVAAVTAAVVGSVAVGVGAAAPPAGAAASAGQHGPAVSAAGEPSVTIKAIDREGKAVAVTASLESAASYNVQDTLTSGHATKVPAGTYNVAAWVWEPNKKAATLVDRAITITSSVTVTFDARPGKLVRFTVNDSTVAPDAVFAEPFSAAAGQVAQWNNGFGPIDGPAVYVVPGPLPSGWDLLLQANLVRHEVSNTASPVQYDLVKILAGNVPSNLTFASTRAGLAQDHVTIRDFGQGIDGVVFAPNEYGGDSSYAVLPSAELGQQDVRTPASVDVFFSPGYRWESVDFAASDDVYGTAPLLAGHTYGQTFNAAVFSPSPLLGPVVYGNTLQTTQAFGDCLLVDAANQGKGSESVGLNPIDPQGWLYEGSKLIAHASGYNANFSAKIPATTQTYTLKVEATRVTGNNTPINGIAKSLTATYTFKTEAADTSLAGTNFWPRIIPQGLSEKNAAVGRSRTTVPITFNTVNGVIAAHDVAVWASVNGGRTWIPLRVTHSGSTWSVVVDNPENAGYVSLKVQGEDAAGFKAMVTAINAYAVS